MLDIKEKKLIQYLLKHKSTFLTGKDLANYMSCSDRTARTYMKRLSEYLDAESGLRILSKQGSGYQLIIEDETLYFQFLSKNNIYFGLENIEITDRHNYILNKLIFEQDCLLFDDLSEELFVSRSTLSSDFKKIREILEKYNLLVESKPNRGVFVSGREQDKRHFIMDYFFSGQFLKNIHHYMSEDVLDLPISFEELTIIVVDECRNGNLGLSDFVIQNLVIHIALAIKRMTDGFDLAPIILSEDKVQLEIAIAQNILRRVRFITQIDFPEEEANYIALHLISKATHDSGSGEHGVNLRQDIMASLSLLEQSDLYSFSNDLTLVEGLSKHLEVLVERIKNGIHLENPLLDDLKAHYSDVFTLSRDFLRNLPSLKSILLSEDELAYISLHFLAAMERYKEAHRLNVLVICATGYGSAQMLKNRIENELGQLVTIVDLVGYYDLSDERLEGIDAIISSIDLSHLVFTVPVFTVSVFLKSDEVSWIKNQLQMIDASNNQSSQERLDESDDFDSIFSNYFTEDAFFVFENADKEEVLTRLVESVCHDCQKSKWQLLDLINQRESMSTVVFDQDIAVPHPIKAFDERHRVAVAIIKNGLKWDENFHEIRLVFLVSPSIHQNTGLPVITKRIVDLTDSDNQKHELMSCQTFKAFRQVFLSR